MNSKFNITILPGDGIGPEVVAEGIKVLEAVARQTDINLTFNYGLIGAEAIDKTGNPLPDESITLCKSADAILLGAIGDPKYDNDPKATIRPEQGLLKLRKSLQLFANLRPVKSHNSLIHLSPLKEEKIKGVDFLVVRELTGGIYFGEPRGRRDNDNTAFDTCVYSKEEIIRVAHIAFKHAQNRKNELTLVDKANVLETSRLWRETIQGLSKDYPNVKVDYLFVDNAAMQMILNPSQFDVILTENMFGDIITDEASVITGSLGLLPSSSIGNDCALFEPIHGSYPQAKDKQIANPVATILSCAMLLEHLEQKEVADLITKAVAASFEANIMTPDINSENPFSTSEVGDWIANYIAENTVENIKNTTESINA